MYDMEGSEICFIEYLLIFIYEVVEVLTLFLVLKPFYTVTMYQENTKVQNSHGNDLVVSIHNPKIEIEKSVKYKNIHRMN